MLAEKEIRVGERESDKAKGTLPENLSKNRNVHKYTKWLQGLGGYEMSYFYLLPLTRYFSIKATIVGHKWYWGSVLCLMPMSSIQEA